VSVPCQGCYSSSRDHRLVIQSASGPRTAHVVCDGWRDTAFFWSSFLPRVRPRQLLCWRRPRWFSTSDFCFISLPLANRATFLDMHFSNTFSFCNDVTFRTPFGDSTEHTTPQEGRVVDHRWNNLFYTPAVYGVPHRRCSPIHYRQAMLSGNYQSRSTSESATSPNAFLVVLRKTIIILSPVA